MGVKKQNRKFFPTQNGGKSNWKMEKVRNRKMGKSITPPQKKKKWPKTSKQFPTTKLNQFLHRVPRLGAADFLQTCKSRGEVMLKGRIVGELLECRSIFETDVYITDRSPGTITGPLHSGHNL